VVAPDVTKGELSSAGIIAEMGSSVVIK